MKTTTKIGMTVLLLGTIGFTGLAHARGEGRFGPQHGAMDIDFAQLDSNGDGTVEMAELFAMATDRLSAGDANADGFLDREELLAQAPQGGPGMGNLFGKSRSEQTVDFMLEHHEATEAGMIEISAMAREAVDRLMRHVDADEDGMITEAEIASAHGHHKGPHDGHKMEKRGG